MTLAAWLLTYAIHSTLFLGLTWIVTRARAFDAEAREVIWKAALLGGLVTATLHSGLGIAPLEWRLGSGPEVVAAPTVPPPTIAWSALPVAERFAAAPVESGEVPWAWLALAGWGGVALALATRLVVQRRRFVRALGERDKVDEPLIDDLLGALMERSGARNVRVTASSAAASPVALSGQEICIPRRALTRFEAVELRALLAHEIAHLVRRDPTWLMVVATLRSIFFFQPLNYLAAREIRANAEELCDARAVDWTGESQALARCLLEVAGWMRTPAPASMAGMGCRAGGFEQRVRRLVAASAPAVDLVSRRRAAVMAAGLALAIACGGPGVQRSTSEQPASAAVEGSQERVVVDAPDPVTPEAPPAPVEPRRKRVRVGSDFDFDLDFDGEGVVVGLPGMIRVEIQGDVEIKDGRIVAMAPGSRVEVEDDRDDVERRLVVTPGDSGTPRYEYLADGVEASFGDAERAWLASVLDRSMDGGPMAVEFEFDTEDVEEIRKRIEIHRRDLERGLRDHEETLREHLTDDRERLRAHIEELQARLEELRTRLRELDEGGGA